MVMSSITVCGSRVISVTLIPETLPPKIAVIESKPLKFARETVICLTPIVHAIRNVLSTNETVFQ